MDVSVRLANTSVWIEYLEAASNVVGVLVTARLGCCLNFAAVLSIVEDLARVLLGLLGRVCRRSVAETALSSKPAYWGC
jgi:hypothetical protein